LTDDRPALRSAAFRRDREHSWKHLELLMARAERSGLRKLSAEDVTALASTYRTALSSLSVARAISLDRNLVEYLEALCARAYFVVYGPRRTALQAVRWFFVVGFPDAVRGARTHVLISALSMTGGFAAGFALTAADPNWFHAFVAPGYAAGRDPGAGTEFLRQGLYGGDELGTADLGLFTSFLFSHNAQIGLLCFALGAAAGLPVFVLLFQTGLMLGAFGALYHERGLGVDLWGWIFPHGVPEIGAVILCGGAGLLFADGLLFPGEHGRLESLSRKGRQAGLIALGCVCMFALAALIEGVFRQRVQSLVARYLVIALGAIAFGCYFGLCGRRRAP
jgi:uncharacterized membrane protein SpoIIM required for sporulation